MSATRSPVLQERLHAVVVHCEHIHKQLVNLGNHAQAALQRAPDLRHSAGALSAGLLSYDVSGTHMVGTIPLFTQLQIVAEPAVLFKLFSWSICQPWDDVHEGRHSVLQQDYWLEDVTAGC